MYDNDNKAIDTTWNLKWKTSTEDWAVEFLSLIRKQKVTSQQQQYALRKIKECWTLWNSDSQDWIKQGMTIPIPSHPITLEEDQAGN